MSIWFLTCCSSSSLHCFYHSPSCSWPTTQHGPLLPSLSTLTLLTPWKPTCLPGRVVKWLDTGLASAEDQSSGTQTSFSCPDPAVWVLGHPAFPTAFSCVPLGWWIRCQEIGWGTAWLSTNYQTLENRLYECLIPPGVLERSKWERVVETCLFEMPTPTQVMGLCRSPGRYRQDMGKGQTGWDNTAHLMGKHPSTCTCCLGMWSQNMRRMVGSQIEKRKGSQFWKEKWTQGKGLGYVVKGLHYMIVDTCNKW